MKRKWYGLILALVSGLSIFLLSMSGCGAERQVVRQVEAAKPGKGSFFAGGCVEVVSIVDEQWQHFVCTDVHRGEWEILVRPKRAGGRR